MEKQNKLKLAVIISVISVIITIISLSFSVYAGIKDVEYKDYIKKINNASQELQEGNIQFEENFKKINLAEKTISDTTLNCESINKNELNKNLRYLSAARNSLINEDFYTVELNLNNINEEKICTDEITKKDFLYTELGILAIIWFVLAITLIKVTRK